MGPVNVQAREEIPAAFKVLDVLDLLFYGINRVHDIFSAVETNTLLISRLLESILELDSRPSPRHYDSILLIKAQGLHPNTL